MLSALKYMESGQMAMVMAAGRATSSLTKKTFLALLLVASLFVLRSEGQEPCAAGTSDKTVKIGERLALDCDCQTSATEGERFEVKWERLDPMPLPRVVSVSENGERTLNLTVNSTSGGVYRCSCDPCEDRCARCFSVKVQPHILDFTIEASIVQVGETFTATCRAVGDAPLQFKVYHTGRDGRVLTDALESIDNGRTVSVNATLKDDGEYICIVSNDIGSIFDYESITVYNPPRIIGSENASVDLESQHTALLTCEVKFGSSQSANVSWSSLDEGLRTDIHHSDKYTFSFTRPTGDVMKFILLVHQLTKNDFGRYLCQLRSKYNELEAEQVLSITTKGSTMKPPTDDEPGLGRGGIIALVVTAVVSFLLGATVVLLVVWYLHKKAKEPSNLQMSRDPDTVSNPDDGNDMDLSSQTSLNIDPSPKGPRIDDMRKRLTSEF